MPPLRTHEIVGRHVKLCVNGFVVNDFVDVLDIP